MKLRNGLVAALLAFPAVSSVAAIDEAEFRKCAETEDKLSRLMCYDYLAKQSPKNPVGANPPAKKVGRWATTVEKNPLDDSTITALATVSTSGKNRLGEPIGLLIRCEGGKTDVYVSWGSYLGQNAEVASRVDDNSMTVASWYVSTTKETTFHPNARALLSELLQADSFVAQVTPYREYPITAIFDVSRLNEAIEPLRPVACGW